MGKLYHDERNLNQNHILEMAKQSAGILVFRRTPNLEFFLIHPGGPYWERRDEGSWSIPKGEFTDELPFDAALREFREETGQDIQGEFYELAPVIQRGGKKVYAWAVEGDVDENAVESNTFTLEWPIRSGNIQTFPEVDRSGWFTYDAAARKINLSQCNFLDEVTFRFGKK